MEDKILEKTQDIKYVSGFANYYYLKNNEGKRIYLSFKNQFNISEDFLNKIKRIMNKQKKDFYYNSIWGVVIKFDISKDEIYQLNDANMEEMEFIRTIYSILDYFHVNNDIPRDLMIINNVTIQMPI